MKEQNLQKSLLDALLAALEYIDALPKDLVLPAMPGFDRDWVDNILEQVKRTD